MFDKDYFADFPLGLGRSNSTDCAPFSTRSSASCPRTRQPSFSCPTQVVISLPRWSLEHHNARLRADDRPDQRSNSCSGGGGARASSFCGGATIGTATIGGRRDAPVSGRGERA